MNFTKITVPDLNRLNEAEIFEDVFLRHFLMFLSQYLAIHAFYVPSLV